MPKGAVFGHPLGFTTYWRFGDKTSRPITPTTTSKIRPKPTKPAAPAAPVSGIGAGVGCSAGGGKGVASCGRIFTIQPLYDRLQSVVVIVQTRPGLLPACVPFRIPNWPLYPNP